MRLVDVAEGCPHGKRSLERRLPRYKRDGERTPWNQRLPYQRQARMRHLSGLRKGVITKRKEIILYAEKLHWRLAKEGLVVPV